MTSKSFWEGGDTMLFPRTAPFANIPARKKHSLLLPLILNSPPTPLSFCEKIIEYKAWQ